MWVILTRPSGLTALKIAGWRLSSDTGFVGSPSHRWVVLYVGLRLRAFSSAPFHRYCALHE